VVFTNSVTRKQIDNLQIIFEAEFH